MQSMFVANLWSMLRSRNTKRLVKLSVGPGTLIGILETSDPPSLPKKQAGLDGPLSCTGSSQRNENHLARYWILDRCVEREKSKLSKERVKSSQVRIL